MVICAALSVQSFTSATSGADQTFDDGVCALSLQLQGSPFKEEYMAKLMSSRFNDDSPSSYSDATGDDSDYFNFSDNDSHSGDVQTGGIDSFSVDCLSCHNGASAVEVTLTVRNSPNFGGGKTFGSAKDHPIGMDYAQYASLGRGYKPMFAPESKMVFINGKVGCLTCHNPFNPEKNHLVMSDRRSALCLTCHDK